MLELSYAIGLDIGGTSMVAGVIACDDGRILSRLSVPTEAQRGPQDGLRRIGDLLDQIVTLASTSWAQIVGIGIGCTGPVDSYTGQVHNPFTLPTWDNLPLVDYVTQRFDKPTYLLGDGHAAGLGEYWMGAGKGAQHLIYITVGTGIGGAVIVNGRLHRGVGLVAGEVGHQVIDLNGPPCYCGAQGCWEMLAAAPAISRFAAEHVPEDSLLLRLVKHDRARITPKLVSEASVQGDPFSIDLMKRLGYYLGVGVGNLINVLAPEVVVMGGGVMQSWSLLAPTILETITRRAAMVSIAHIRIVPASLGLNAGITGAARAILDYQNGNL